MDQRLDGDAFLLLWRTLLQMACCKFFWLDQTRIEDAILNWLAEDGGEAERAHEDTEELSVSSLYGEVCRRVDHSIRAGRRCRRREHEYARRKKSGNIAKNSVKKASSAGHIDGDAEIGSVMRQKLEFLLARLTGRERDFVALRRQGVKDFHAHAKLLGVTLSSPEEQKRVVGREWHRLQMKLRRMAAK